MLDLQKSGFMSDEQIKEIAPAVFTQKPSNEVSKHYTHIPTTKVINDMRTLGWDVVDVKEVKARKNGEGFAQLDKWKGSADLLILKKDFSNPMVYLDWDLFKEFLYEYRQNRRRNESGEQAAVQHFSSRKTEAKSDRKKSTSKIPSRKFYNGQGSRQIDRKPWPKSQRKIAKRSNRQESSIDGTTQLQTRWQYLKSISQGK